MAKRLCGWIYFLILMIALLIGAIAPPLLLLGIATGIIFKLIWSALGKSN